MLSHKGRSALVLMLMGLCAFLFSGPRKIFDTPYCTVLASNSGDLLSVRIAGDMQWRFPPPDEVPERYLTALRLYEDEYFYRHPGVNPVSMFRALMQNIRNRRIVSGGSTLTMQTVRLSRPNSSRNLWNKFVEIALALRLELRNSKSDILRMYATHAPMGGNIVGLEAASRRYFNRSSDELSWAEAAMLSVLPNAPSLLYPGKNDDRLRKKRDRLLDKLQNKGYLDPESCELAKEEPIPDAVYAFPNKTPHLLDRAIAEGHEGRYLRSSLQTNLQERVNRIAFNNHERLHQAEIHNLAILVLRVKDGAVLAYCGNTNCEREGSGKDVDVIRAPRSTGSTLKPFLYEALWHSGKATPDMLIPDIPTQIGGFTPRNFDEQFDGAVPANKALARSLNIPAVRLLQSYGVERFHADLQTLGLSTIRNSPDHYGLSLILGGAEARLDELSMAYLNIARVMRDLPPLASLDYSSDSSHSDKSRNLNFDRGSLWWLTEALSTLNRPAEESGWEQFRSSRKVAWKTGTSFGHRDAWAIGYTPEYVVGVWVGNADGEGRPGLTGVQVAAPILFRIFNDLPTGKWFHEPYGKLRETEICTESGHPAGPQCTSTTRKRYPTLAERAPVCNFHERIHLDISGSRRVHSGCYPTELMQHETYFVLPPVMEWYYRRKNPAYRVLPPYRDGCDPAEVNTLRFIYPRSGSRILIPRELGGKKSRVIAEIAISHTDHEVFWHLDNKYLGSTRHEHQLEILADPGKHILSVVDQSGQQSSVHFEIVSN
ncbi:MAG: penicillin-binding protein 1C [Flavobacteriales bacterium]|nr:penicillin-binding protein 1C [Flavobacteriales bacterium]